MKNAEELIELENEGTEEEKLFSETNDGGGVAVDDGDGEGKEEGSDSEGAETQIKSSDSYSLAGKACELRPEHEDECVEGFRQHFRLIKAIESN